MSKLRPKEYIELIGPLGNGWNINNNIRNTCLIGGGSGIASLLPLAKEFAKRDINNIDILLGGKSLENIICIEEFSNFGNIFIATEDGSFGKKGLIDTYFNNQCNYDMIYTCGPDLMMRKTARWAKKNDVICQVSLEERMGCGFGVCMGCVCKIKDENGNISFKRICKEGPIFTAKEVFFDD